MADRALLAIGEVLVDLIIDPRGQEGAPAPFRRVLGGSVANVAATYSCLGGDVLLVGGVGVGPTAAFLVAELERRRVTLDGIVRRGPHRASIVIVSRGGASPEFESRRDADVQLDAGDIDPHQVDTAGAVHTSLFALAAAPARDTILGVLARAAANGAHRSLDLNFHPAIWGDADVHGVLAAVLPGIDLVKASDDDLRRLFGAIPAAEAVARLRGLGARAVVHTSGSRGVRWSSEEGAGEAPARAAVIVDTTGAGDAFLAGVLRARLDGARVEGAVAAGLAVAARKLAVLGPLAEPIPWPLPELSSRPGSRDGNGGDADDDGPVDLAEAEHEALALLREAASDDGFVASVDGRGGYERIWARDGAVACLAAVATGEDALIAAAIRTLDRLADGQGPHGEIPSNVGRDGVSFGRLAGRVDAAAWFALAAARVARIVPRTGERWATPIARALRFLEALELNARGLVHVPIGGDWADEYVASGYLLAVQALRLLALDAVDAAFRGLTTGAVTTARELRARLELDYWVDPATVDDPRHYHPHAYRRLVADGPLEHWVAGFDPTGYSRRFDALANVLATAARLADIDRRRRVAVTMDEIAGGGLLPAFAPVIVPGDAEWPRLLVHHRYGFRNEPGAYHNGGRWPWITGLWAAAVHDASPEIADRALRACARAVRIPAAASTGRWGFTEYVDARTERSGGVGRMTWSAAAFVLGRAATRGDRTLLARLSPQRHAHRTVCDVVRPHGA